MPNNMDIVNAAREFLGAPFVHQGRSVRRGIDCGGLIYMSCAAVGIMLKDTTAYSRESSPALYQELRNQFTEVGVDDACSGCIVGFEWKNSSGAAHIGHCGILTPRGFIHAFTRYGDGDGHVAEITFTPAWKRKARAFFRVKGVLYPEQFTPHMSPDWRPERV